MISLPKAVLFGTVFVCLVWFPFLSSIYFSPKGFFFYDCVFTTYITIRALLTHLLFIFVWFHDLQIITCMLNPIFSPCQFRYWPFFFNIRFVFYKPTVLVFSLSFCFIRPRDFVAFIVFESWSYSYRVQGSFISVEQSVHAWQILYKIHIDFLSCFVKS